MKSLRWYAILSAGALLFTVNAGAQLQKGGGRQQGPPSSPPQSGGREAPRPRENPSNPPQSGGREAPKPKENPSSPPQSGGREAPKPREVPSSPPQSGGREAPKPRENPSNPPQSGGREAPKPRENPSSPPQSGGREAPKPREYPSNPPSSGGRNENPISGAPVRGGNGPTGVRQGSDPLGRIPRNENGTYQGSINNNNNGRNRVNPITVGAPPSSQSLANLVLRESDPRKRGNIYDSGWRTGYYHYYNNWCDDYFWCSNYVFNPWSSRCVCSPWYYYTSLPGYLNYNCIRIINIPIVIWRGSSYRYDRYDSGNYRNGYDRSDVDYAVDDIIKAFERQDRRALGRLIPNSGRVDIYSNGDYDYSLDADDFYDLMQDGIYNTQTRSYDIQSVRTYRNEIEVVARHDYQDPWGRKSCVYHWYRLEDTRYGFVITKFGTSSRNCW